ncbi:MAG: tetraacyldisaccharide 4'-kinase [Arenicellaceae bacterium]|nr:tetraacyldisaccharide 4'-kinase [Arenicellaceae bacterium]
MFNRFIENTWQQNNLVSKLLCGLLVPISYLYRAIFELRKYLYKVGIFKVYRVKIPVVVVGNLSVGGTGKTPLVIALAKQLGNMGYSVGIVTRGYGGSMQLPVLVGADSVASTVGDEAIVLAERTGCPVMAYPNRVAAARELEKFSGIDTLDILISDDGLQHYSLGRDVEIIVHDPQVAIQNSNILPAGPWRESADGVDDYDASALRGVNYDLLLGAPLPVRREGKHWKTVNSKVHAVAGIGKPLRFFKQLREAGYEIIEHAFSDHYEYSVDDLVFNEKLPILMTEKDAVKCRDFNIDGLYYVPATAQLSDRLSSELTSVLKRVLKRD